MTNEQIVDALRSLGAGWWPVGYIAGRLRRQLGRTEEELPERTIGGALGRMAAAGVLLQERRQGVTRWRIPPPAARS